MSEERYLESVQRDILKSKKWKRFVRKFDIGKDKRVRIKAVPVRFVYYIAGDGKHTDHAIMACYGDEIILSTLFYGTLNDNMIRHALTHELVHLYLRANDVASQDGARLFEEALRFLKIDFDVDLVTRYRRRSGKDRRWLP